MSCCSGDSLVIGSEREGHSDHYYQSSFVFAESVGARLSVDWFVRGVAGVVGRRRRGARLRVLRGGAGGAARGHAARALLHGRRATSLPHRRRRALQT